MTDAIEAVRAFNRMHTRLVGALDARFLDSDLSLAEARLLFELARREGVVASDMQALLGLDAGYLSRMLRRFETRGWISRGRAEGDARRRPILVTPAGHAFAEELDARSRAAAGRLVEGLGEGDRAMLANALGTARNLLGRDEQAPVAIRTFRTGDMGMITARQAIFYEEVYGWDTEALIGDITVRFLRDYKPGREQCWVAERAGAMAGSIFLVDVGDGVAQLRLLYVEPFARGAGVGTALVDHCIGFAREAGYRRISLWTHSVLEGARRIYHAAGFRLVASEPHNHFGTELMGETWEYALTA